MKKRGTIFRNGQISVEYLILIGFIVFLVISLLGVSAVYTSGIQDRIKSNQLTNFANKLTSSAETVFYSGEPSRVTINAYLPDGVQNISIVNDSNEYFIVFEIYTSSGLSTIGFSSDVPLDESSTITINEGLKRLQVISTDEYITIVEG